MNLQKLWIKFCQAQKSKARPDWDALKILSVSVGY